MEAGIRRLYKLESAIKGRPDEENKKIRQEKAQSILEDLHAKFLLEKPFALP